MATAELSRPKSRRQEQLELAAKEYCRVHDRWVVASNRPNPDEEYWDAVDAMFEAFDLGDIPEQCRPLAEAVERFRVQVEQFDNRTNEANLTPHGEFWAAREAVAKILAGGGPKKVLKPLESMKYLRETDHCSDEQIAKIYGLRDASGNLMPHLVQQELDKPGSVIDDNWVDPRIREQQNRQQAVESRHDTLAAKAKSGDKMKSVEKKPCKETPEELWRDHVSISQASRMLMIGEEEVAELFKGFEKQADANKAATNLADAEKQVGSDNLGEKPVARKRGRPAGGGGSVVSPQAGQGGESGSKLTPEIETKITELYTGGTPTEEIAESLKIDLATVKEVLFATKTV